MPHTPSPVTEPEDMMADLDKTRLEVKTLRQRLTAAQLGKWTLWASMGVVVLAYIALGLVVGQARQNAEDNQRVLRENKRVLSENRRILTCMRDTIDVNDKRSAFNSQLRGYSDGQLESLDKRIENIESSVSEILQGSRPQEVLDELTQAANELKQERNHIKEAQKKAREEQAAYQFPPLEQCE